MSPAEAAAGTRGRWARHPLVLPLLGLGYFASAWIGLSFARPTPSISAIWPASGVALAIVLLRGPRIWPAIALGAFAANFLVKGSAPISAGIAIGNTLEAVAGAWLVRRFAGGADAFERGRDVLRFTALAAVASTAISATVGVASLLAGGAVHSGATGELWVEWWLGDLGGDLVVAPVIVLLGRGRRPGWPVRRWIEAGALFGILALLARSVLVGPVPGLPLERAPVFLCLPLLIWAATRFGPRETSLAVLMFATILVWGTRQGMGPFVRTDATLGFLLLSLYASAVSLTLLVLATSIRHHRLIETAFNNAFGELGVRFERRSEDLARVVAELRAAVRGRVRAERYAEAIVQTLSGPLLVLDSELRVCASNPAFHRYFGVPWAAVHDRRIFDLGGGAWDIPRLRQLLEVELPRDGLAEGVEVEQVFPRLGRRALVLNARFSEAGRLPGRLIVLAFEDVTEKRRAEDALRASEEQFRTVAESAVEAILTADAWGHVRFINPAAQRMFDWNAEELTGQPLGVLVPELGTAEGRESARLAAAFESDAAPAVFETYGIRRDGSPVPLEVSLADWRSRQQQYLTVVARDVSLRKAAEDRLTRSELQLEHAQTLAHVGSWSWDSGRRELTGSRELFRIHGLEPQSGPQPEGLFLERIHPRDRARFEASARRVLRTREPARLYYRIIRSDGTVRWIHGLAQQDAVGNGHWTVSGIAEDVTGRVRALRKIRRLNAELERRVGERTAQLERSNLDLQQFAYVAAHDLQEPLRTVAAFTQLLARRYRGRLDADADEIIAFATDGAVWMHRLIEDLLLYSRVGAAELVPVTVEMSAIVTRAINNLSTTIREAGATVRYDPLPRVEADASLLTLLFQNLIGNAVKFHGAAAPEVHIQAERSVSGWTLVVGDNGIGIPPHSMRRIFDIFQRLHTREEFPGTGIGLAICRRIVERHGGRIWAESEPGRGSMFYFTLPTASAPPRTVRQRARDVHGAANR